MRYLILLARKYPYRTGETFLENEIEELSRSFDRVLIYPSDVSIGESITRSIPYDNVESRVVETVSGKKRKFGYIVKAVGRMRDSKERDIVRKGIDSYFICAARMQYENIMKDLDRYVSFDKDADTVYVYSYWLYITAYVAVLMRDTLSDRGIVCRVFSRAHRFDLYEDLRRAQFLPRQAELMERLDKVFPCSDNGSAYLKKKYPAYENKIETSYLGTYDHGIGKYSDRKVLKIVSCSRLTTVKRVGLIADALSLLKDSGLSISWTHIGGGELYKEVWEKCEALSWMTVNFTGNVSNTEVYDYYKSHEVNLFINVSSSEGLPVSIMEAISFGIPVIATDVGGTAEIVVNDVSGSLIGEEVDVKALSLLIEKYAQMDEAEYQALRSSTRRYWEEKFQAAHNYDAFVKKVLLIGQ